MRTAFASRYKEKLYSIVFSYPYRLHSNLLQLGFTLPLSVKGIRCFSRNCRCACYFNCVPTRVSRTCSFGVSRNLLGGRKSLSVHASPQEAVDQVLNEFLAAIEDPYFAREELCLRYIQKLSAAGSRLPATKIIDALRVRNIFLGTNAYNYLLEAAAARNDIYLLIEIFKDLLFSCQFIELMPFLLLARAFSSNKDSAIMLAFITEVSEMELPRCNVVLNRIIFALGKCGQVDRALLVFQHMKSLKCRPDLVTYNTILEILGRLGRVDEMLHEFAFMKSVDLVPDIFTYNTMLNSLRKMGRLNLCLEYFHEMTDQGIQPDLWTFKDLIESLGRSGNIEDALKVFSKMKCMGIQPSIQIYKAIIFSLKRMGKMELALKFSNEMNKCIPYSPVPRDFQSGNR